ncbi:MAG: hypothetical protein DMG06_16020 [Acidobacteria bacterium]|nr:MAG: hypothetical protein DMG06_16020 [Acidobacteriota bacterium]
MPKLQSFCQEGFEGVEWNETFTISAFKKHIDRIHDLLSGANRNKNGLAHISNALNHSTRIASLNLRL